MTVHIQFFSWFRDLTGCAQTTEAVPDGSTLGDLYQKTGRLKLAAAHWERALQEWNKTVAPEIDQEEQAKVTKKLESAKVKLAQESK